MVIPKALKKTLIVLTYIEEQATVLQKVIVLPRIEKIAFINIVIRLIFS